MRALVLAVALLLAGCEHMYGAMDAGRLAPGRGADGATMPAKE
ncbi:hypothetical protein [Phenylobacterium sp.]